MNETLFPFGVRLLPVHYYKYQILFNGYFF